MPGRSPTRFPSRALIAALGLLALSPAACSQPVVPGDAQVLEARDALLRRDRNRLVSSRVALQQAQHPLAVWAEYWELGARLNEAKADDIEAFYARWPGSYLEDRLRNDWLLELGRRRDFPAIGREFPRFRMNDDRQVTCYWLLSEHLAGREVRDAARTAWFAQRDLDDGCHMLATAMVDAKRFTVDDVWRKARLSVDAGKPGAAKAAAELATGLAPKDAAEAVDNPSAFLKRPHATTRNRQELRTLALLRLAAADADAAVAVIEDRRQPTLAPGQAAWVWASIGRQAALKLSPDALAHFRRAWSLLPPTDTGEPGWTDDTLAWAGRSALRAPQARDRWPLVLKAVAGMTPAQQADTAWIYWKARALQATAKDGAEGDAQRADARRQLTELASPLHFYGQLATEDLGQAPALPVNAAPTTPAERETARNTPGFRRAMHLAALGLRDEARREWNFTLRGLGDRELLAAARWACEAGDWQLCINTSDRTKTEFDLATRYPMPFMPEIQQAANAARLEPAFVLGIIRQETRFMPNLRSHAGAAGLMQLMPNTAKWIAKKIGQDFNAARAEAIFDPTLNLRLGTSYLKMVLDDLSGSQPMAAAAYNAGPGRPRRWREGPVLEPAAWAEAVPFNETRDYVKKVTSNTAIYAALLNRQPPVLKSRLGPPIGPRDSATPVNGELP